MDKTAAEKRRIACFASACRFSVLDGLSITELGHHPVRSHGFGSLADRFRVAKKICISNHKFVVGNY